MSYMSGTVRYDWWLHEVQRIWGPGEARVGQCIREIEISGHGLASKALHLIPGSAWPFMRPQQRII